MNDVINQITESHGRSNMFACTMLKALIQSKRRGCNVLSSYSHLNSGFLFVVFLTLPLLLRASPRSNPIENASSRPSSTEIPNASPISNVQCQRSLLGKKQDKQSSFNHGSSSLAPIIDELVGLNLSGRTQGPSDSLWRPINVQSLIAEKRAEIERTLGKARAIELFKEVQVQVLSRLMQPDDHVNRGDGRASADNSKRQHKVKAFKPTLKRDFVGHSDYVFSAVFSPEGRQVLTASEDKTAKLWDAMSGQLLHTFDGHSGWVLSAVFSPEGRQVLTASLDKTAKIWDAMSGQLLHTFDGHSGVVYSAVFSPDRKQVLTASDDKTAKLWDATSGQLLHTLDGHSHWVRSAVFSYDGRQVLTASLDKTAKLWDATNGQLLHTFDGHSGVVHSAVFSPDGRQVLTASYDHTAKLWDATSGQALHTFDGHSDDVLSAVFSPDGRQVLTASSDHTAKLWDATSGQLLQTIDGHSASVKSAVFSPDGRQVLTASSDRTAKLWSIYSEVEVDSEIQAELPMAGGEPR